MPVAYHRRHVDGSRRVYLEMVSRLLPEAVPAYLAQLRKVVDLLDPYGQVIAAEAITILRRKRPDLFPVFAPSEVDVNAVLHCIDRGFITDKTYESLIKSIRGLDGYMASDELCRKIFDDKVLFVAIICRMAKALPVTITKNRFLEFPKEVRRWRAVDLAMRGSTTH